MERLAALDRRLARSTSHGFAGRTAKNIKTQINKYVEFCQYYGLFIFETDGLQFRRYLEYLTNTHKSMDSMKNYISGARTLYEIMGFTPPHWSDYLYRLTAQGITRDLGHVVQRAFPVTSTLLVDIYAHVDPRKVEELVAWNVTLLGFYTFMRKMNLMPDTLEGFDPDVQLARGSFREMEKEAKGKGYIITVYHTKTIQFKQRLLQIPVCRNPDVRICPVFWYELMVKVIPAREDESVFTIPSQDGNAPITYGQWTHIFRQWLEAAGYNSMLYRSHSMRRGGASWGASCKLPPTR